VGSCTTRTRDRGTSRCRYQATAEEAGIAASMGAVGTAYHNAAAESVFAVEDRRA
jgi:transposase InsO family protein